MSKFGNIHITLKSSCKLNYLEILPDEIKIKYL